MFAFLEQHAQAVALERREGHRVRVGVRVQAEQARARDRGPDCVQEVRMQMVDVLHGEGSAARCDHADADVVAQDHCVEKFLAACMLLLRQCEGSVHQRRAWVPAHYVGAVDLVGVPGRSVHERGQWRRGVGVAAQNVRLGLASLGGRVLGGQRPCRSAAAERRAAQLVEDH